jgi:hypothetical protein
MDCNPGSLCERLPSGYARPAREDLGCHRHRRRRGRQRRAARGRGDRCPRPRPRAIHAGARAGLEPRALAHLPPRLLRASRLRAAAAALDGSLRVARARVGRRPAPPLRHAGGGAVRFGRRAGITRLGPALGSRGRGTRRDCARGPLPLVCVRRRRGRRIRGARRDRASRGGGACGARHSPGPGRRVAHRHAGARRDRGRDRRVGGNRHGTRAGKRGHRRGRRLERAAASRADEAADRDAASAGLGGTEARYRRLRHAVLAGRSRARRACPLWTRTRPGNEGGGWRHAVARLPSQGGPARFRHRGGSRGRCGADRRRRPREGVGRVSRRRTRTRRAGGRRRNLPVHDVAGRDSSSSAPGPAHDASTSRRDCRATASSSHPPSATRSPASRSTVGPTCRSNFFRRRGSKASPGRAGDRFVDSRSPEVEP